MLVANCIANTAYPLKSLGRQGEAWAMQERSVDIIRRLDGRSKHDDETLAHTLIGLGNGYREQGRYADALARLEEGLEIQQRIHPEKHSQEAAILSAIGLVLWEQDRTKEAIAMHKKALKIYKKTLGPNTAQVARVITYIAQALEKQKK